MEIQGIPDICGFNIRGFHTFTVFGKFQFPAFPRYSPQIRGFLKLTKNKKMGIFVYVGRLRDYNYQILRLLMFPWDHLGSKFLHNID